MSLAMLLGALLLIAAACGGSGNSAGGPVNQPSEATPTPQAEATATVNPEEEVLDAYLAYWEAYSRAVLDLDLEAVEGFAADFQLYLIREEIEELRSEGFAVRIVVEHQPVVVEVGAGEAIVFDTIVNNSFYVDAETKEPPAASGSGEVFRDTYHLEYVDGRWLVVRSSRQR